MEKCCKLQRFIILIPTPDFPNFYYMLGGNLGYFFYEDVSVMEQKLQNYEISVAERSALACQTDVINPLKFNNRIGHETPTSDNMK